MLNNDQAIKIIINRKYWNKECFERIKRSIKRTKTKFSRYVHVSISCAALFSCKKKKNIYTGAGHIIRISSKSWFISLIPFKKWNLYNVYIHSPQTDIFQVFISFNFDDYNWQLMKNPNSVSQKIRILLKTNTKKGFLEILANWKVWTWKVWACTALNT